MEKEIPTILLQLLDFGDVFLITCILEGINNMLESGRTNGCQNEIFLEFEKNNHLSSILEKLVSHPAEKVYLRVTSMMENYYNVY